MRQQKENMSKNSDTNKLSDIAELLVSYEKHPQKADEFLETQFTLYTKYKEQRAFCQFIFLTVLRNKLLFNSIFEKFLNKKTRPLLLSLLKCAAAELIENDKEKAPKIINSWVEATKKTLSLAESKLANAVLRKFFSSYLELSENAKTLSDFALLYSHPNWLAKKWAQNFGEKAAIEIMKNNNRPAEVFFRLANTTKAKEAFEPFKENFEASNFENFYKLKSGSWKNIQELLKSPHIYIQDPATNFAPTLLAPKASENILDLCAAPGGKSRLIADKILESSAETKNTLLVSLDTPSPRIKKLKENLAKIDFLQTKIVEADLLKDNLTEIFAAQNLPQKYDAILLDAPCSNTGVLRRRPDARYRISESDIKACSEIQTKLIKIALPLLSENGRLVYSTCSIEKEENLDAPQNALKDFPDFQIKHSQTIIPSESDGAGICLISRK